MLAEAALLLLAPNIPRSKLFEERKADRDGSEGGDERERKCAHDDAPFQLEW